MEINTLYEQIQPLAGKSGGGVGTFIFIGVFFAIIIALIIVAVIGSRKDAIDKLIENDKRKKVRTQASQDRIALFSSLYYTIENLNKELKDFKPSVGTKSLGDINTEASSKIKEILKSEALTVIYKSDDYRKEIEPVLLELSKVKPSNWTKEATFATSLIEAKFNAASKKKEYAEDIKRGKDIEWK